MTAMLVFPISTSATLAKIEQHYFPLFLAADATDIVL
jgi:hypothetical protein